jgi:hypothetical protein
MKNEASPSPKCCNRNRFSFGDEMQSRIIVKTLFVWAMVLVGTSVALAADSAIGTWKLNLAKSTFSPG